MLTVSRTPLASPALKRLSSTSALTSTSRPTNLKLLSPSNPRFYIHLPSLNSPSSALGSPSIRTPSDIRSPSMMASPMYSPGVTSPSVVPSRGDYFHSHSPSTPVAHQRSTPLKSCMKKTPSSGSHTEESLPLAPPMSAEPTVTQATFKAAELQRRALRPTMHLALPTTLDRDAPFFSPITPRGPTTTTTTTTSKRVHISPVVHIGQASPTTAAAAASPIPFHMVDLTHRLDRLAISQARMGNASMNGENRRVLEEVGEEGEKYTLNMRRGTPMGTPRLEMEFELAM